LINKPGVTNKRVELVFASAKVTTKECCLNRNRSKCTAERFCVFLAVKYSSRCGNI
jgi:hypothetical protein